MGRQTGLAVIMSLLGNNCSQSINVFFIVVKYMLADIVMTLSEKFPRAAARYPVCWTIAAR